MVAEKRIYSTTALQNCYRALRSARWSVRRKDEHMTRCCEVRELYAKCQLTHSHPLRSGILALCNKRWLEAFLRNRVEFTAMLELTFDLLNYRLSPLVQQFQ